MDRAEELLRDLVSVLRDMGQTCRECVPMEDALSDGACSRTHYKKYRRTMQEALRLLRSLDRERAAAKNKPN